MSTYMKRFIMASLIYLGLAAVFGILNGVMDLGYFGNFAHTHFNLLGFMSMMVFGIGYFILPRFNGTDLQFPSWIAIHFWLANISLVGMVLFRGLYINNGEDLFNIIFIIMATIQVITIFMFIINIWLSLSPKENTSTETATPAKKIEITADSRVADLVDMNPEVQKILISEGLQSLALPGHLDKVRLVGVTLGMAAGNHGLNLNRIIERLSALFDGSAPQQATTPKVDLNLDILIGDVIKQYPASRDIFSKYFGDGCFDCPGQAYESIDMACRMHSVDPHLFLKELKTALSK